MFEFVTNIHMHTRYSDGHGSHEDIVNAALEAGIDGVIVTDHNVWVDGLEGYTHDGGRKVLMLIGEEVHDQVREPQKNHLLVIGAGQEMASLASDPQKLIDGVSKANGLSFLAHPCEKESPGLKEPDLSWVDWQVSGYTGIELWNAMSEFKEHSRTRLHAAFYAFNPPHVGHGPSEETLKKWDALLRSGRKVVAIGGTDAHQFPGSLGPLRRTVFPYLFHFKTVNTHLLLSAEPTNEFLHDRELVMNALRAGHAFIGYDLPAPTHGFRFTAQGQTEKAWMGDEISSKNSVTLQIRLPQRAECHLLKDGEVIKIWAGRDTCTHITGEPGVYRVEVFIPYLGRKRGWIYSNPIYVR